MLYDIYVTDKMYLVCVYVTIVFPKLAEAAGNARGVPNDVDCVYQRNVTALSIL